MAGRERLMLIKQHIQSMKKVSVVELSQQCKVTEETIRRDLDKLEAEGVVTRVHGGAIWNSGTQKEGIHFYRRMTKHMKEKQEIARKVVEASGGEADDHSGFQYNGYGSVEVSAGYGRYYGCNEFHRGVQRISAVDDQYYFYRRRI